MNSPAKRIQRYEKIASDWSLWIEYVDRGGEMTREEFDQMLIDEKVRIQVEAFENASTAARLMGGRTSEAKKAAARANGRLGGRPRSR